MTNKEIANHFQTLGNLMELHGENPFKIRSYSNAYITLRKLGKPLKDMSAEEISSIKGVGKAISGKINELLTEGKMNTLEKYKSMTPDGIIEMLQIKGFGPKKIAIIWKKMEIDTISELVYACRENRLIEVKGFGLKTQAELLKKLEYHIQSKGFYHFATLEKLALPFIEKIRQIMSDSMVELTGDIRRKMPILKNIEMLINTTDLNPIFENNLLEFDSKEDKLVKGRLNNIPVHIYTCQKDDFGSKQFKYTGPSDFIADFLSKTDVKDFQNICSEENVFQKAAIPFIPPALRDIPKVVNWEKIPKLIEEKDIKGVVHLHTTYSDGLHSLEEMVAHVHQLGYEYIGVTDHSKSAFYANGLRPERVIKQWNEIDEIQKKYPNFKIFKGIESDILNDGRLDYEDDILKGFDFIIASVHSNLKMDKEKATSRIIKAVENPYTTILGHMTGRLLLMRKGYPIDHRKIIDACAQNDVAIEINAHPYRLDIDWKWVPYALEKGVKIAINPDAHSKEGVADIRYGVAVGRKGGLTKDMCFNLM